MDAGASVVRLPAFYGLSSGLHVSLARGTFRMPGNGQQRRVARARRRRGALRMRRAARTRAFAAARR